MLLKNQTKYRIDSPNKENVENILNEAIYV